MFKVNDRVTEIDTNIKGVIIDIDETMEYPYGVLFEDVDDDKGVWWCDNSMIEKDINSTYSIVEFIQRINKR